MRKSKSVVKVPKGDFGQMAPKGKNPVRQHYSLALPSGKRKEKK